jgi:succinoglycan biosynthesis protein ExoM
MPETAALVSVCVCTCRRPAWLAGLLDALAAQRVDFAFEVVVVDNDPAASAAGLLAAAPQRWPRLALRSAHEGTPGVVMARNRSVALARAPWVAFVDDDELPDPGWLAALVSVQQRHAADAALGPVLPLLDDGVPAWLHRLHARSARRRWPSGTPVAANAGGCGNALVSSAWLRRRDGAPFDARFNRSGGEDTDLFAWLLAQRARVVWCDEACAFERIGPERARVGYVLGRSWRSASLYWRACFASWPRWRVALAVAGGVVAAPLLGLAGLAVLPFGLDRSVALWARALRALGRAGAVAGAGGAAYG